MLHAMVMAGGGGTRFWPRSRAKRPKQFLTMTGDRTLLQSTIDRVEAQAPAERTWVITAGMHRDEAARQLPQLPAGRIVGEPAGRDTAACVGLGAALIARQDADATILVMPADHVIEPVQEFRRAVHAAEQVANDYPDALITFGIPPTYPSTGYGYIHRGEQVAQRQGIPVCRVKEFKEKPDPTTAERFVVSGNYYWNSGIFAWKASAILGELKRQKPQLLAAVERIADAWGTPGGEELLRTEYPKIEKISVDYAVMEHANQVLVLQAPYRWDDVGSWLALERMHPQDADGNTVLANHCGLDTRNCVVVGDPDRLVTTIGVKDLIVIQDGDAVLIADRTQEGAVKQLVDRLNQKGLERYL
jgi:mannose-1-phosphate guanylyltransferase